MFKLKFANTYDNSIFTKYNMQPVQEDAWCANDFAFCVADGVTRDGLNGKPVPYPKTKEEVEEWLQVYPNPSGAEEAAIIIANSFVEEISKYKNKDMNKQDVFEAVRKVNEKVWEINKNRNIDYLKEDYYCAEAVGGIIKQNKLYCFAIGDCHITLLDKNLNELFTSDNCHKRFEEYLETVEGYDWDKPECRVMVRRDYRNKPDKKLNGKDISFGAISGEKEVEYYISTYEIDLSNVAYICAYSDGCEPNFENKEAIQKWIEKPEAIGNEGKEKTLVLYEKI